MSGIRNGRRHLWLSLAVVGGIIVLWWLWTRLPGPLAAYRPVDTIVPTPEAVALAFARVAWGSGYGGHLLHYHLMGSLLRVLGGFLLALVTAVPLGLAMGTSPGIRAACAPVLEFYRPLPPLAYYTILVLWLGIGNSSKIALLFLAAFPPLAINAMAAVQSISSERIQGARSLGADQWQVFRYVIFPSCLPQIFTGIKVSLGFTYTTLVAAEIVAASTGIGWMTWNAKRFHDSAVIFMGNIVLGVTGVLLALAVEHLEAHICPWRDKVT